MLSKKLMVLSIVAVAALSGCNGSSKGVNYGVYQGVVWGDDEQPLKAQVVVQVGEKPQLALWDEREHQISYGGSVKGTELTFSSASLNCVKNGDDLSCENSNGSTLLSPVDTDSIALSSFSGTYKSRSGDALYLMEVDGAGSFTITGDNCESEGSLSLSSKPENVVNMLVSDDQCLQAGDTNIVTLVVDNESLISANIQTESDNFPQVWVQL